MADFTPTFEQEEAIQLATDGNDLAINALAGAGKTSTLVLIAEAIGRPGTYAAFNKKIATDSMGRFPSGVKVSTMSSLAWWAVVKGTEFHHRMDDRPVRGRDLVKALGLDWDMTWLFDVDADGDTHPVELSTNSVARIASQTVSAFCQTADREITARHVPYVRAIDAPGEFANNRAFARRIAPLARNMWEDISNPKGRRFNFSFDHFMKIWEMNDPEIPGDFVLFDEAQDANGVMISIVEQQDSQRIWVGDSNQQIYGWRGAVDALDQFDVPNRCGLTQSFRFGPEIAGAANQILGRLGAPSKVIGAGPAGVLNPDTDQMPDVYLGRTNSGVIGKALALAEKNHRVFIQGGTKAIEWFAREAEKVMNGQKSDHPELIGFTDWGKVVEHAEAEGGELGQLVNLLDKFKGDELTVGLRAMVPANKQGEPIGPVDVTVSTAHKSKGAEWDRVELLSDFPEDKPGRPVGGEELRLLYVAATRAKRELTIPSTYLTGDPVVLEFAKLFGK